MIKARLQSNRAEYPVRDRIQRIGSIDRIFRLSSRIKRSALLAVAFAAPFLISLQAAFALAASEPEPSAPAGQQQSELHIGGWQGAKNYAESFPITVGGGSTGGAIRFLCTNCTVSPATGTPSDTYTVTVQNAGSYSLTAIMAGNGKYAEVSDSRRGASGKTDQAPLAIDGWGKSKSYYRTFAIKVTGGSLHNAITFETDGCTVSPQTGPVGSQFTVTVTRVGTYTLTALMDGDSNHNKAYSAQQSGVACKSDQSSIHIEGWQSDVSYGDTFSVRVSGGSSKETLNVVAVGCTATHTGGGDYDIAVNCIGPYSLSATRAGNYGYNEVSAFATGMSRRAAPKPISISGWVGERSAGDTFPIRVSGGIPDGQVRFATSGCTVSPLSGTVETDYFVTVNSVGSYTLTAYVDGSGCYNGSSSREVKGMAGKAPQAQLSVNNWNGSAATGSSFDIRLLGGGGTGTLSITTGGGCYAVPKNGEANAYTVTVTAPAGGGYSLAASKPGDANYFDGNAITVDGVAVGQTSQSPLSVNGWKEDSQAGDAFAIHLDSGEKGGEVSFSATGCIVEPASGDIDDVFTITVTAAEGETYSVSINRMGESGLAPASVLKSGNVRPTVRLHAGEQVQEKETPMLGNDYDIWLLLGMIALLVVLLFAALVLQHRERRYRRV